MITSFNHQPMRKIKIVRTNLPRHINRIIQKTAEIQLDSL